MTKKQFLWGLLSKRREDEEDVGGDETPFITTWQTDANDKVIIPVHSTLTYDYDIDWGDGTKDNNLTGEATHTYSVAGEYDISISKTFPAIYLSYGSSRTFLLKIKQWGSIEWGSFKNAFNGASNLENEAIDIPKTTNVTDFNSAFSNCVKLTHLNISNWDLSSATELIYFLYSCRSFDEQLNIDIPNVSNMTGMFKGCSLLDSEITITLGIVNSLSAQFMFDACLKLNKPITINNSHKITYYYSFMKDCKLFNSTLNIDTSGSSNMAYMFKSCNNFNQPLDFDTSNVTTMEGMFYYCNKFNQSLSNFDTSKVTSMKEMFYACNVFNQSLSNFDTSKVTTTESFLYQAREFNQVINFNLPLLTTAFGMFAYCSKLNEQITLTTSDKLTSLKWLCPLNYVLDKPITITDTSKVTNINSAFTMCYKFNQPFTLALPIVQDIGNLFNGASDFNQDISHIGTSHLTKIDGLLAATASSSENYSKMLNKLFSDGSTNLSMNSTGLTYTLNGLEARDGLISNGWTITGDAFEQLNTDPINCSVTSPCDIEVIDELS